MGAGGGYPVAEERGRGAGHRRADFRVAAGGRGALLAGYEDSEDRRAGSEEGHPREPKHEDHTGFTILGTGIEVCLLFSSSAWAFAHSAAFGRNLWRISRIC